MKLNCVFGALLLALAGAVSVLCAEPSTGVPIKELGEDRLQIGAVTLDPKLKSLTFPAFINMTTGMVEYAIVATTGKVHESLLRTDAAPYHLHTAMLLLGMKPAATNDSAAFFDPARQIPGAKVQIEITVPGPDSKTKPLHHFLAHAQSKTPIKPDDIPHWIYNGSQFAESVIAGAELKGGSAVNSAASPPAFLAQREGSIVSLIADPAALINNPRPDRQNDELWILHAAQIPPINTPVQVKFTLK